MKLVVNIESNNAAFEHAQGRTETAYLLGLCANLIVGETDAGVLKDFNGNTVGSFSFHPNEEASDADVPS